MSFVLLDEILELEPGRRALARKVFSPLDDYLADHFPGYPVVPGVLLTEAMAQTGGWLILHHLGFSRLVLLVGIHDATFRQIVLPGQEVRLEVDLESGLEAGPEPGVGAELEVGIEPSGESDFVARCRARVGRRTVAEAHLAYRSFPLPRAAGVADQLEKWTQATWARLRPRMHSDAP